MLKLEGFSWRACISWLHVATETVAPYLLPFPHISIFSALIFPGHCAGGTAGGESKEGLL